MTPERPRRAGATDTQVETPVAVSRVDDPSALQDLGSEPLYAALDLGTPINQLEKEELTVHICFLR